LRRRLLALSTSVTLAVLLALVVPLLMGYAERQAVELHETRLAAATRFATLAASQRAGSDPSMLAPDIERYDDVTLSTQTWVLDASGAVVAPPGDALPEDVPGLSTAVDRALSGTPTSPTRSIWPWDKSPVVVVTPIGRDAQVLGAVVMIDDARDPRAEVGRRVVAASVSGIAFMGLLGWLVGVPLVGWVVRPVEKLEERARELAGGRTPTAGRLEGPPELKRLVESFNDMAASVDLSRRQQRELVADVSHQLANPLTALRLRLELLAVTDPSVGPVLAETERMARALDAVIEVSRAGGFDRSVVEVDLADQVRARILLWEPVFEGRLRSTIPLGPVVAWHEEDLVPTVLDVLLDNALKYAPGAAVAVRLVRRDGPAAAEVDLEVRDFGTRATFEEIAGLGGRFERLQRHAHVEGTGLGLAIVSGRAQDAGGALAIEGAEPGLRVRVTLPVGRGSTEERRGAAAPAE